MEQKPLSTVYTELDKLEEEAKAYHQSGNIDAMSHVGQSVEQMLEQLERIERLVVRAKREFEEQQGYPAYVGDKYGEKSF